MVVELTMRMERVVEVTMASDRRHDHLEEAGASCCSAEDRFSKKTLCDLEA